LDPFVPFAYAVDARAIDSLGRNVGRDDMADQTPRRSDSLLAKPVRVGLLPPHTGIDAAHGDCDVVRGCPLETDWDSC
jgi:hypothetical protein